MLSYGNESNFRIHQKHTSTRLLDFPPTTQLISTYIPSFSSVGPHLRRNSCNSVSVRNHATDDSWVDSLSAPISSAVLVLAFRPTNATNVMIYQVCRSFAPRKWFLHACTLSELNSLSQLATNELATIHHSNATELLSSWHCIICVLNEYWH